jgi:hypothetical protein
MQTFTATLRNGQIVWGSDGPPNLPANESVPVQLTVLPEPRADKPLASEPTLLEIMERFAASGGPTGLPTDPEAILEWQREIRKDRPLPGREE